MNFLNFIKFKIIIKTFVILIVSFIISFLINNLIKKIIIKNTNKGYNFKFFNLNKIFFKSLKVSFDLQRSIKRTNTITTIIKNIVNTIIIIITSMLIFDGLGLSIKPLLTSIGIVSIAIGFGTQQLVRDFIAGILIIIEDQYSIGDLIKIGDTIGIVESITLRITQLRDEYGVVWYLRNGEIFKIANYSQIKPIENSKVLFIRKIKTKLNN